MIISRFFHIPAVVALGVIAVVLTVTVVASLRTDKQAHAQTDR